MSYAPERSVKSGKTFFVASPTLDKTLGHDLELVPLFNPVTPMGSRTPIRIRLLHKGKPLSGERVSFIPRGS